MHKTNMAICAIAVLAAGCAEPLPKCSNESTVLTAKKLLAQQIYMGKSVSQDQIAANISISLARPAGIDEVIRKTTCAATFIFGGTYKVPLAYSAQLDDAGNQVVSMERLVLGDTIGAKVAIEKAMKLSQVQAASEVASPASPSPPVSGGGFAPEEIVGIWRGRLEGDGYMEIKPGGVGVNVELAVSTESGCSGTLELTGKMSGQYLVLETKNDSDTCTIAIDFSSGKAAITEDGCSGFHGAACGFTGTLSKQAK